MQRFATALAVILVLVLLAACGGRNEQPSDIEIQATVQAALVATQTAQANFDNAVSNAVNATAQANAPTPTPQTIVVTATPQAGPTIIYVQTTPLPPTATPVNVVTLTEEELVALINQAVTEAYAAAEAAYTTTTTATADEAVSTTESQALTYYVQVSAQKVDEALALIEQYYALYSEVSAETLALLQAIESDLNAIADNTASMAQSLQEINTALQQGVALAEDTITQLNAAAQNAQTQAQAAQTQAQTWSQNVKNEINTRGQLAANVQPNAVANNPQEALGQLQTYIETARSILAKGTLSAQDIQQLAQQGANLRASVEKFGGAHTQTFSAAVERTTVQIARGELPQAKQSLNDLERNAQTLTWSGTNVGGGKPGGVKPGGNNPGGNNPGGNNPGGNNPGGNNPGGNNPKPNPKPRP